MSPGFDQALGELPQSGDEGLFGRLRRQTWRTATADGYRCSDSCTLTGHQDCKANERKHTEGNLKATTLSTDRGPYLVNRGHHVLDSYESHIVKKHQYNYAHADTR
jgi:hypothetical protein